MTKYVEELYRLRRDINEIRDIHEKIRHRTSALLLSDEPIKLSILDRRMGDIRRPFLRTTRRHVTLSHQDMPEILPEYASESVSMKVEGRSSRRDRIDPSDDTMFDLVVDAASFEKRFYLHPSPYRSFTLVSSKEKNFPVQELDFDLVVGQEIIALLDLFTREK